MSLDFRYRRLGYVALNVTDIERSSAFYTAIVGLAPAGETVTGERLFRCTGRHHDVILHRGGAAGLHRIAWEMESAKDLERIEVHLDALGLPLRQVSAEECEGLGFARAIRMTEPHTGACFEYFCDMAWAPTSFAPTVTKIARLGHVVLATNAHGACERFFLESLNYRVSDRIERAITFLRCFPNPLHHSLGLSHAEENRLHHVNFMVTDMDDIGKALYRLQQHQVPIVFGPGRHPPSDSIFLYFLDPDQLTLEFSFGMEEFPELAPREPRLLPLSLQSIDHWGAVPQPGFGAHGVIETAPV